MMSIEGSKSDGLFLVQRKPLSIVRSDEGHSDHRATGGYMIGHVIVVDEKEKGFYVTRFAEDGSGNRHFFALNPAKTMKEATAMFNDMIACQKSNDAAEATAEKAKAETVRTADTAVLEMMDVYAPGERDA